MGILSISVALSLSISNVTATVVNNTDFSIDIPDNWVYDEGGLFSAVALTPNEFGVLLLNNGFMDEPLNEKIKDGGAYSTFEEDWKYSIKNAGLDLYVKYEIDKQDGMSVTSIQNVTMTMNRQ